MKRKLMIILFILALIVIAAGSVLAQDAAGNRTAPVTSFECPAGQTCHTLFGQDSQSYALCANGHWEMEMFGADSALIKCVSEN